MPWLTSASAIGNDYNVWIGILRCAIFWELRSDQRYPWGSSGEVAVTPVFSMCAMTWTGQPVRSEATPVNDVNFSTFLAPGPTLPDLATSAKN